VSPALVNTEFIPNLKWKRLYYSCRKSKPTFDNNYEYYPAVPAYPKLVVRQVNFRLQRSGRRSSWGSSRPGPRRRRLPVWWSRHSGCRLRCSSYTGPVCSPSLSSDFGPATHDVPEILLILHKIIITYEANFTLRFGEFLIILGRVLYILNDLHVYRKRFKQLFPLNNYVIEMN